MLLNGSPFTLPAGAAALTAAGAFTLTGTTSTGGAVNIGYSYDPAAANLDFLRAGQSLTITYAVQVNDGTTNSGTQDVTFTITGTNDAPTSTNDTVTTTEDTTKVLSVTDFGYLADLIGHNAFAAVKITTLASNGTLQYDNDATAGENWVVVTLNQEISVADITAGRLRFVPDSNENGAPYATIGFHVGDGTLFSTSEYTLTVDVTAVLEGTGETILVNNDMVDIPGMAPAAQRHAQWRG